MTASERLVEQLGLTAHDAVAVHNPSNMFYLTQGYTGEGAVYISGTRRVIVTDFRYTEQAERQALRQEYIQAFRANLKQQLDATVIVEPDGTRRKLAPKAGQKPKS